MGHIEAMAVEHRLQAAERALDEHERSQLRYADALTAWGEAGGYDAEVVESDTAAVAALGLPWHEVRDRPVPPRCRAASTMHV